MNEKADARAEAEQDASAVTIYQVAARAGVSIATVSHAINRPERVAETTRRRILETAEELGFVPRGRGKATQSLRRIVACGPFSDHPSYVPRLLGVLDKAAPQTDVIVVDDSPGSGEPTIDSIAARGPFDGAILMGAEPTERLARELEDAGVPVVLLDRPSQRFASVAVGDEAGGALVADHLLGAGATSFGWVSQAPASGEIVTNGELRLRGFVQRLRERGVTGDVPWTICDDSFDGGRAAAAAIAAAEAAPDAVFALHDVIAAGLVAGFREVGLRVPEDVRVVGYDDVEVASLFSLTTVRQPFRESGRVAVETLRALRADPRRPITHVTLMPELVVRSSTGARSGADDA